MNRVTLVGFSGKNATTKMITGGRVSNCSVATEKSWKDKSGEWKKSTTWHNLVAFGRAAEHLAQVNKGEQIFVEGEIQVRQYEIDGQKKTATEILVSSVHRLQGFSKFIEPNSPEMPTDVEDFGGAF